MMSPMSAEATVVRNYVDWMLALPWSRVPRGQKDIDEAEQILNEDHYGLEKPKERILEYLAVQKLVERKKGPILCLVGPARRRQDLPRQVDRALHGSRLRAHQPRRRARRGRDPRPPPHLHRRHARQDHPGPQEGRLACNPVFLLDEIDKMSMDFRGDPSPRCSRCSTPSRTTPSTTTTSTCDYDLSRVMFMCTANVPAGDPAAASGPHGDHPAPRLHREREASRSRERHLVPEGATSRNGLVEHEQIELQRCGDPRGDPRLHARESGVREIWSARSPAICRKVGARRGEARADDYERTKVTAMQLVKKLPGRAQVPLR